MVVVVVELIRGVTGLCRVDFDRVVVVWDTRGVVGVVVGVVFALVVRGELEAVEGMVWVIVERENVVVEGGTVVVVEAGVGVVVEMRLGTLRMRTIGLLGTGLGTLFSLLVSNLAFINMKRFRMLAISFNLKGETVVVLWKLTTGWLNTMLTAGDVVGATAGLFNEAEMKQSLVYLGGPFG